MLPSDNSADEKGKVLLLFLTGEVNDEILNTVNSNAIKTRTMHAAFLINGQSAALNNLSDLHNAKAFTQQHVIIVPIKYETISILCFKIAIAANP